MSASTRSGLTRPSTSVFVIAGILCVIAAMVTVIVVELVASRDNGGPTDYTDIVVNGDFGAPVIMTKPKNFTDPQSVESRVLIEGQGTEIVADQAVVVRTTSFDSHTGALLSKGSGGTFHVVRANQDDKTLGDLATLLVGHTQGTRLLIARPDSTKGAVTSEIIVMDMLYTSAQGDIVPAEQYPHNIAELVVNEQGIPEIHATGSRINKLETIPVVTGHGAQVEAGNTIAIQYVITDGGGNVIDSTWASGVPVVVEIDKLMEGLRAGLENQKVGSRVLVAVPSAMAAGDGDRIAVVDILATGSMASEDKGK